MTPDGLSQVLLQDEYNILDISSEDFSKLESHIRKRAYVSKEFDTTTRRR